LLYSNFQKLALAFVFAGVAFTCAEAQTPKPPQPQPPDTLMVKPGRRQTPQVVTIVHRVNGIKAVVLMRRSGEMIASVDDKLMVSDDAVTSITAGFVLGDGESIVARLSQAEAEAEAQGFAKASSFAWSYQTPPSPKIWDGRTPPAERAEFVVVESSGKQLAARYVGLDGGSGLSLLTIPGLSVPPARDANEEKLAIGQRVRLFAPVRISAATNKANGTVSISVGEIVGKIVEINRTSTGKIANLTIKAQNLSPMNVGGVVLNDAGETIGIVETSDDAGKASLIPAAAVRRAANRVFTKQASVPRPWLGVRGEAVATFPLEKFFSVGWTEVEVAKLKESYQGLLLTAVAPGTPAALADLRPGDVIVRVNDFDVKSAEDFSFFLNEAGGGATVNFTFFRGQTPKPPTLFAPAMPQSPMAAPVPPSPMSPKAFPQLKPLEVSVKMGEALNPARSMRLAESLGMGAPALNRLPPITRGLETVALSPKAAAHLGARGGVLVVFVDPESAAARAGVRVFDVIESVEGKPLGRTSWTASLPAGDPQRLMLGVVREREKLEIKIEQTSVPKK
jgi:S1-C subfamily serine protease